MDQNDHLIPADQPEARSVSFTDMDVSKGGRVFEGYAAVYGQEFDAGAFVETMLPPTLRSGIAATPNCPMLWNHNQTMPPFATTGAGTLELAEDRKGLRVKAEIDERHILGPTLISMIERGEVRGMSVGMVVGRQNQKLSERAGRMHRAITGMKKLLDVSPTWEPAYEGTSAELRSLTEAFQQVPALVPEQVPVGEPQSVGDGQHREAAGVAPDTPTFTCACGAAYDNESDLRGHACEPGEPDEQRSAGVAPDPMVQAAARRRRLQLLGIHLPG
jgi:HK97 family phage prohead protease